MRAGLTLLRTAAIALAICAAGLLTLAPDSVAAYPKKDAYIVVDMETGVVLGGHRSRSAMRPASLTKMMTLYLVFEALEDGRLKWDQKLPVSAHAASMPHVKLGLRRGDKISVGDAVIATAISSSNDAAVVLAEALAGSEREFAKMMTIKARMIGLRDTSFRTANGLDAPGHMSTARDMAVLARRLYLDFPKRYDIMGRRSYKYKGKRRRNTNPLLGKGGVDGMKTGRTYRAGYNLAASATRRGERVLVIYMGGPSRAHRSREVLRLIAVGFATLKRLKKPGRMLGGDTIDAPPSKAPVIAPRPVRPRTPTTPAPQAPALSKAPRAYDPNKTETASLPPSDAARIGEDIAERLAKQAVERPVAKIHSPPPSPIDDSSSPKWAVQIGAFKDRSRAEALMRAVIKTDSAAVAGAYQSIEPVQIVIDGREITVHRVRFTSMSQRAAGSLCAKIQASKMPCALVPPSGWDAIGG